MYSFSSSLCQKTDSNSPPAQLKSNISQGIKGKEGMGQQFSIVYLGTRVKGERKSTTGDG